MKHRTWPVLLFGLGLLFLLITIAGLAFITKTNDVYRSLAANAEKSREYGRVLDELTAYIYSTALATRDLIVDPTSTEYPAQVQRLRQATKTQVQRLLELTKADDQARVEALVTEVNSYWDLVAPLLRWSPEERARSGIAYLKRDLRGRRTSLVSTIGKISQLNQENLARDHATSREIIGQLDSYMSSAMVVTVLLGLVIVAGSVYRVTQLEKRADQHRRTAEEAEHAMRELSHKVVHAQEEERKAISRELHDEVGQLLTALRIELGNLQQTTPKGALSVPLADTKSLAERSLRAVRDIAMGLRPSMLDDLGLGPAIEWQGREFSRRLGIPVEVTCTGELNPLSDAHRTCIYRVVQEALTNCARHAKAGRIQVRIRNQNGRLRVQVSDDGRGMDPGQVGSGLGLLGMKERARELNGRLDIESSLGRGTTITVEVPVDVGVAA